MGCVCGVDKASGSALSAGDIVSCFYSSPGEDLSVPRLSFPATAPNLCLLSRADFSPRLPTWVMHMLSTAKVKFSYPWSRLILKSHFQIRCFYKYYD